MPLDWIEKIITKSSPLSPDNEDEANLVNLLIDTCNEYQKDSHKEIGYLYAAAFDLIVAAQYYSAISHSNWLYCPTDSPKIFFHYTNCCPRCVLTEDFFFSLSNKPSSGKIGTATSRLLLLFLQAILLHEGRDEEVLKGTEPVDAVIINKKLKKVLFAEIKASPLITPPLAANSQKLTEDVEGEITERGHSNVDHINLFSSDLEIMVPVLTPQGKWDIRFFPVGQRKSSADKSWGLRGVIALLNTNKDFFS